MSLLPTTEGRISPLTYIVMAPLLILAQHGIVALGYQADGSRLALTTEFWLFPLRRLTALPNLEPWVMAATFVVGLALIWWLAALSFQRAAYSHRGYALAAATVIPGIQIAAATVLALLPVRRDVSEAAAVDDHVDTAHVVQGLVAGIGLIVLAVLISALTFGAYGWGLFVGTPFMVGLTTAYIANRDTDLGWHHTMALVGGAGVLGGIALITFALEGLICLILASPLVALVAILGGALGRAIAKLRINRRNPLACIAILPAFFALEAAMPPAVTFNTHEAILIDAPAAVVWRELVSDRPIELSGGTVGRAGLAFPLRSELQGQGVGARRRGIFSTGVAVEEVTVWKPGRSLEFKVLQQPPAMEEMSPYRKVHAPHVIGYFETGRTGFELQALGSGQTRLTVTAAHQLRIDPIPYWEPMARWAAGANAKRVLEDIKRKAEAARG